MRHLNGARISAPEHQEMPDAVIVDCLRTPVGKAPRGALRNTRPDDLAATVIRALLDQISRRFPKKTSKT